MIPIPGYILTSPVCEADDLILYQATRVLDGLPVLLKVPAAPSPTYAILRRLEHEYELASDLGLDLIARPLALERHADTIALVLEQGPDRTLADLLGSPMGIPSFLKIALGITAALAEIHSHELIHKDLKPEHVLLNAAGHVWLTGLGIGSRLPRERQPPESPEVIAATLAYMAPEQTGRMNRSIDSRSDLYALGIIFYQMLTGVLPFTADDPMEWVHCHIARQPVPPSQRVPGLPEPLSALVMKLLAKTAEERYQSTVGLDADLRRCLAQWESDGRIEPFPLGEHDMSERLLIPEKLYGRQAEIDVLLAAFDRVVATGTPELVMVSGYSGVGKTAVVNELHKALVSPRGLFAAGKFDQHKRDIPYATLAQALESLIRPLLGKSETELDGWRQALREALGPNGQLIVDLVPELKLIIGEQPLVLELEPQQAKTRFRLTFRRFVGVFARPEHPLALFLDDLQWLDAATLDVIEDLLTHGKVRHLLLIGAYRDNEVSPVHPLMQKLDAIRKAGAMVQEITLAPLVLEDLIQLIADSLHCELARAAVLARLIHAKTAGNPFFAIQFLSALAQEGLVAFDQGKGGWSWDLNSIHAKGYTDNVADLMAAKLTRLPSKIQCALKQLACFGNVAEIQTLSFVLAIPEEEVHEALREAVHQELVQRLNGSYRFVHDRVHEAAYALIPEGSRAGVHLRTGRLLLAHTPEEKREESIYEIISQLNRGATLMTSRDEREELAQLNLIAGKRAKSSTAYASALANLAVGAALLAEDRWERQHELAFALAINRAECEYLRGGIAQAEAILETILAHTSSTFEMAAVYDLRLKMYQVAGNFEDAIDMGHKALHLLQVDIPESDADLDRETQAEAEAVRANRGAREIAELAEASMASDPLVKAVMGILANLLAPAFVGRPRIYPLLVLKMVNYSLRCGLTKESCLGYSNYGILLCARYGDPHSGFAFSELSIDLNKRLGDLGLRGTILYVHAQHVSWWLKPVALGVPLLEKAFLACLNGGDLVYASYVALNIVWQAVERGDSLGDVLTFSQRFAAFARDSRYDAVYQSISLMQQFLKCLMGKTNGIVSLDDGAIDESSCVEKIAAADFNTGTAYYHAMKMIAAYLLGDDATSLTNAEETRRNLTAVSTFPVEATFHFFHALVLARSCRGMAQADSGATMKTLHACQKKLACLARDCPENFSCKDALVAAEIAAIEGDALAAERLFEQAIQSAHANGFVHVEALACELAAAFYRQRSFDRIADAYLREACAGYARWGAQGKARQLEQRYPQLREASSLAPTAAFSGGTKDIDILALVQASQAISSEILLDHLIETLMRTVLTTAGARQGCLLLTRDDGLSLAAEARVENQKVVVQVRSEQGLTEAPFPVSIVNYVRRSRDKVLLDDATGPNPYSADEYFSHRHPKSVLCFSITKQATLIGLLYLENDLATQVFTPDRLAIIELLAAQAAISLENALVYEALRESEQKFRVIFDQTFQFIGVLSVDGKVLQANQTALQFAGVGEDAVLGKLFWETSWWAHSPGLQQRLKTAVQEAAQGELVRFEATHIASDGQVRFFDFSLKPVTDAQGRVVLLIPEGRDITERKRAEAALQNSEALLRVSQHLAKVGGWQFDIESGKSFWSDELYRIHEIPRESEMDHIQESMKCYRPEDWRLISAAFKNVWEKGELYDLEFPFTTFKGNHLWIRTAAQPVYEGSKIVRVVGIVIDITDRKRAEEELRKYKDQLEETVQQRTAELLLARDDAEAANRAKSVFLANMSHELRTPLNAVLGFSQLMRGAPDVSPQQVENLNIIIRSGEHLLNLINNILDISKIESGRVQLEESATDLHKLLHEMWSMMYVKTTEKGLDFVVERSPDFPGNASVDAGKLRQVLINLVGNAVKYSQTGGVILRAGVVAQKSAERVRLEFEVKDTGQGIREEDRERIFSPFVQLGERSPAEAGTGLGLTICKQFVELMGGTITVGGEHGKGSVFHFEVPVEVLPTAAISAEPRRGRIIRLTEGQPHYRFLIAEDQLDNRLLLHKLLEPLGFELREATNGEETLAIFEEWHPHLIFMDIRMPVMDGLEATRLIKATDVGAHTKIIAVTAHALEEDRRDILSAGCDDFIRKPFKDTEIFDALTKHLGARFVYEDEPPAGGALTAAALADLPAELRNELEQALVWIDIGAVHQTIEAIRVHHPSMADALAAVAKDLQFGRILRLLGATDGENSREDQA